MIDLATARETFEASTDGTVGIEEEFALLDPGTLELAPRFETLRDAAQTDPVLAEAIAGELISSEIEIRSGRGDDAQDARERQADRRRPVLPMLLAISANSPSVDGMDSGLHTARTQTFTKSFPRCGVPDVFGSWRAWADYVELLVRTGSIVEFTQLWWSVRPHHDFGTVEVRICDAQTTAQEADQLAALIVACVRRAAEEVDARETPPDVPGRLIEENVWRAIRHGLDGSLLALTGPRLEPYPAAEALDRLK